MKRKFSFYEQIGILIPGGVLLFGLLFYIPDLQTIIAKEGIGLGALGVFIIVAYAAGHAVAALGNIIDSWYWKAVGGMPSNWVIGEKPKLLSPAQIASLEQRVKQRFGLDIPPLKDIQPTAWYAVTRQIYSDAERYGKPERVDIFNGNYGLNRGLGAAMLALIPVSIIADPHRWYVSIGLLALVIVYVYRMQRFGQHYARELFNQFLLLPPEPGKPKKVAKQKPAAKAGSTGGAPPSG